MGSGIYSIGVSSLQNAQLGLATTSHNIANANTEGYNRQRIIQTSNIATLTGAGYVGQGAHVSTIERIYNSYVAKQVSSAQTAVSELDAYSSSISQINNLLLDGDAGLASALEGFFTGINQVSSDPSSLATRQTMVSSATAMVARFQSLNSQIDAQYEGINNQIQGYVTSINSYAEQIATLNKQIIVAESSTNQPPNDLYDQRDQVVSELNKLVGVQTTTNSNGSLNVFFGNGQQLVVGLTASTLKAVPSSADPSRLTVGLVNPAGTQELPASVISGGALAGVLGYRSETLDEAANELGRIAASLALTFNAQHALGQDLLGHTGNAVADFFKIGTPTVISNTNNNGDAEISATFVTDPGSDSDGTFFTKLTTSDYRLSFDGVDYKLTRLSDNESWTNASLPDLSDVIETSEGFGFQLDSGSMSSGDTILIQPTRNAAQNIQVNNQIVADVRLIAAGASTASASTGAGNTSSATISVSGVATGAAALPSGSQLVFTATANPGELSVTIEDPSGAVSPGTPPTLAFVAGTPVTYNNMTFTISGTPDTNDSFTIDISKGGVSDNRNALLLAKLQTGKTMDGNTASYSTVYAQMVSDLGNKGNEVKTLLAAQTTLLNEAKDARDSISGVNIDEEAAKLIEYQQSYQAAAKMLQIASELFDSILAIR